MFIQMWFVVFLVLFAALGVWALIFAIGILAKLVDIAFNGYVPKVKTKKDDQMNGDRTL